MLDSTSAWPEEAREGSRPVDVTIVMPCLDETLSLGHCIANAREALARLRALHGLRGEIVVADNGSTDGSQRLAADLGARVVAVENRGYGAALIGGCEAASGRFLLMGDADGSYDFTDGVAMIGALLDGADLCMGSRFRGGIAPGAMPWKNRYVGNPALTGILNLFFRSGIEDAHCGLRAITREAFRDLRLRSAGMEFASEMVIKASLKRMRIAETPATLSIDLRDRPPHLRPWRDGWRHLRHLLMLSPTWAFGVPAVAAMGGAGLVLLTALLHLLGALPGLGPFGASWTIVAGSFFAVGHFAAIMALATHLHGVREGFRTLRPFLRRHARVLTLETMLAIGVALIAGALVMLAMIAYYWSRSSFAALPNPLPVVMATTMGAVGLQTVFGGFLLAIIGGHAADFAAEAARPRPAWNAPGGDRPSREIPAA